jgi:hypothetical protein
MGTRHRTTLHDLRLNRQPPETRASIEFSEIDQIRTWSLRPVENRASSRPFTPLATPVRRSRSIAMNPRKKILKISEKIAENSSQTTKFWNFASRGASTTRRHRASKLCLVAH